MLILISNDDGIHAPGIMALATELRKVADITIVAPIRERSAASQSVTISGILTVEKIYKNGAFFGYAVDDGTPVDCVALALDQILDKKPDYIFSGINSGANLGISVHYSGTVAAANEGFLNGIPAVAISAVERAHNNDDVAHFEGAAFVARRWLELLENGTIPKDALYNINVPSVLYDQLKGYRITDVASGALWLKYNKCVSQMGAEYYQIAPFDGHKKAYPETSDIHAAFAGYVSVSPLGECARVNKNILDRLLKSNIIDEL